MRSSRLVAILALLATPAVAAHAQFSVGLGGGTGIGSRGGGSGGGHGNLSIELKLPVLPGIRGDAYFVDAPGEAGNVAIALSGVLYAPIPVLSPYLIGGWGSYGIGDSGSTSGWNLGIGAKASIVVGPALFIEVRRHQRISRDLLTVGLRF